MAASIEGAFILLDKASGPMKNMERQAERTMAAIRGVGAAQDATSAKQQRASAASAKHSQMLRGVEGDAKRTTRATTDMGKSHDSFTKSTNQSSQSVGRYRSMLRGLHQDITNVAKAQRGTMFGGGGTLDRRVLGGAAGVVGDIAGTVQHTSAMKDFAKAGKDVGQAFGVAGEAMRFLKDAAIPTAVRKAVAAVDALGGGLIALVPQLLNVAQGMSAIPGTAALAAQGMLTFKAALNGVGAAVTAGMQAQNQWAYNQRGYAQQVTQAQFAVQDAMHGVTEATYAQGVASHSLQEALYGQRTAHHDLTEAIYTQTQAQISLTVARRDAIRTLQDMEFAANTAILKEARAGLDIQQAKQTLQQMMLTPGTTSLQLEGARLGVMEAQASAAQTHTQAVRSRVDYSRAARGDPTSAPSMQLASAQHAVATATYGVAQAHHSEATAAYAVTQARHGMVTAAYAVVQAEHALGASQFSLNTLMRDGNAGAAAYKAALRNLSPAQQAFVKFLVGPMGAKQGNSLIGHLQALQNMAGKGLFPGLEKGIRGMSAAWGPLGKIMEATGKVLGGTLGRVMNIFTGPQGLKLMEGVGNNNVGVMKNLGDAFVSVAHTIRTLMVGAEPFLMWLSEVVKRFAAFHDAHTSIDGVASRLDKAKHALQLFGGMLKSMWTIFKDVMKAAAPLGDMLWGVKGAGGKGGATGGLMAAAAWTQTHGPEMKKYFLDLYPTLHMVGQLMKAIGKAFLGLGQAEGQKGATTLLTSLTKIVPVIGQFLHDLDALTPGLSLMFKITGSILNVVAQIIAFLFKIPVLGKAIGLIFGALFSVVIIGRFTSKLWGAWGAIKSGAKAWNDFRIAKQRALGGHGMSPTMLRTGASGEHLTHAEMSLNSQFGVRSRGPGSTTNPLMVRMDSLGANTPVGSAEKNAASRGSDLSKGGSVVAKDASKLSRAERLGVGLAERGAAGGIAAKALGFIPGLGGVGRGAATVGADAAKVVAGTGLAADAAGGAGILSKFGGVAGGLAKVAGPLGIALTVLPGILSFIGAKGSVGTRLGTAAGAMVSSATFGLINPNFNGPTKAHQVTQGQGAGNWRFNRTLSAPGMVDPMTGAPTAAGIAHYRQQLGVVQGQYNVAAHGTPTRTRFGVQNIGQDAAVRQESYAQIMQMEKRFADQEKGAGVNAGKVWADAYGTALQSGQKPKQAMGTLLTGLKLQMAKLTPDGKKSLDTTMAAWGAQMVANNPKLKGPINDLNNYITGSFQNMGQQVQIVNGQILTNSQTEWQGTFHAMTDPMQKALEKLNGTYAQIQAKAVGELQAMGLKKSDAQLLLKNPASANAWVKYYNSGSTGQARAGAHAGGGRVAGNNTRDVYGFGQNLLGGGELVVNRHQEQDANARLMRHGEPSIGSIVANRKTPHWAFAQGGYTGYSLPLPRSMMTANNWSIDMGVDIPGGVGGEPEYAIGPGTIVQEGIQGFGPNAPILRIDPGAGPLGGKSVYYGHAGPDLVRVGQRVTAGQQISSVGRGIVGLSTGPHIEIGFGPPFVQGGGAQMAPVLHQLLGGAGVQGVPGGGGTAGGVGAAQQIKALHAPQIGGSGVPAVLANRAASNYAHNLTAALNYGLSQNSGGGMNFGGIPGGGGTSGQNQTLGKRMMLAAGWGAGQWPALRALWNQESGWNANAVNSSSGAYGIPQSLGHGHPYNLGDPKSQIAWGLNYIKGRYGSPNAAEAHEQSFNWYGGGGRVSDAGWFGKGGTFTTNGPTVFGAGEVPGRHEQVTIEPAGRGHGRAIHIQIDKIEVHRKGDIKKIIDEEFALLSNDLDRGR